MIYFPNKILGDSDDGLGATFGHIPALEEHLTLDPWLSTLGTLDSLEEFLKIQIQGPYSHIGLGVHLVIGIWTPTEQNIGLNKTYL